MLSICSCGKLLERHHFSSPITNEDVPSPRVNMFTVTVMDPVTSSDAITGISRQRHHIQTGSGHYLFSERTFGDSHRHLKWHHQWRPATASLPKTRRRSSSGARKREPWSRGRGWRTFRRAGRCGAPCQRMRPASQVRVWHACPSSSPTGCFEQSSSTQILTSLQPHFSLDLRPNHDPVTCAYPDVFLGASRQLPSGVELASCKWFGNRGTEYDGVGSPAAMETDADAESAAVNGSAQPIAASDGPQAAGQNPSAAATTPRLAGDLPTEIMNGTSLADARIQQGVLLHRRQQAARTWAPRRKLLCCVCSATVHSTSRVHSSRLTFHWGALLASLIDDPEYSISCLGIRRLT